MVPRLVDPMTWRYSIARGWSDFSLLQQVFFILFGLLMLLVLVGTAGFVVLIVWMLIDGVRR